MVSALAKAKDLTRNKGVVKRKNGYYIKTRSGKFKKVSGDSLIYHRGKGEWSQYSPARDRKTKSKTISNRTKWKDHQHMYDLKGKNI